MFARYSNYNQEPPSLKAKINLFNLLMYWVIFKALLYVLDDTYGLPLNDVILPQEAKLATKFSETLITNLLQTMIVKSKLFLTKKIKQNGIGRENENSIRNGFVLMICYVWQTLLRITIINLLKSVRKNFKNMNNKS